MRTSRSPAAAVGLVERGLDAVVDEVEGRAARPLPGVTLFGRAPRTNTAVWNGASSGHPCSPASNMRLPITLAPVRSNVSRDVVVAPFLAALAELQVLPEEALREDPRLQLHPLLTHQLLGKLGRDETVQRHRHAEEHLPGPRHVPAHERRLRRGGRPGRTASSATRCASGSRWTCRRRTARARCSCPTSRTPSKLDFAEFLKAFDELVARSRKGTISPDDFMGTTVSLTNPGTVGTTSSAPRLMPGQGVIVATGALDYPAEYQSMAPRTLGLLGISKVMTVTSTYDHRIIQGAESGLFLARMEELLKGEDGFYERDLRGPRPAAPAGAAGRWTRTPASSARPAAARRSRSRRKVLQLIHNYRVRGHLVADLDPLDRDARAAPRPRPRDLRPHPLGPRPRVHDRTGSPARTSATLREILDILRETYCGTIGVEYMYIADPERKDWLQQRMESTRNYPALDAAQQAARPREARRGRELRALPAHEVRRPQALLARGRRGADPAARPHPERRGAARACARS